jgi:hypothetical protein
LREISVDKKGIRVAALPLALRLTAIAGWAQLKDISPPFNLGVAGAIPMILIEDVHGGGTHIENLIGGTVFVIVNVAFFYLLLHSALVKAIGSRPPDETTESSGHFNLCT